RPPVGEVDGAAVLLQDPLVVADEPLASDQPFGFVGQVPHLAAVGERGPLETDVVDQLLGGELQDENVVGPGVERPGRGGPEPLVGLGELTSEISPSQVGDVGDVHALYLEGRTGGYAEISGLFVVSGHGLS